MKKIFANYFPQYHPIELNNKAWGQGFTDWVNVKNAKPQFKGHQIPKIPLNKNYYSLLNSEVIDWQIDLALKNKINGFNFYHYWFDGRLELEKPLEIFKNTNKNRIQYCLTWANESWTKQWVGSTDIIIEQKHLIDYSIWDSHLNYLITYFRDESYLKINNKCVFCIYRPELIPKLENKLKYYDNYVRNNSEFDGIHWIGMKSYDFKNEEEIYSLFNNTAYFQPRYLFNSVFFKKNKLIRYIEKYARSLPWSLQNIIATLKFINESKFLISYQEYVEEQNKLCDKTKSNIIHSIAVDWDNTARYGERYKALHGYSDKMFERMLTKALASSNKELLFINAWNEWAESAYLEPDEFNKYSKLNIIKSVVSQTN